MKLWVKLAVVTVIAAVGGAGGYGYYLYTSAKNTADQIYVPVDNKDKSDLREEKVSVEKKQPFSVLLMGVDERQNDTGRTDTLVVLSVNPNRNSILMFNIPRDTRTEIAGLGKEDKINHAYAFGGVIMSINTVEKFLNVPIDYYVEVNMEGFSKIIDLLEGVDVQNNFAFSQDGHIYNEGPVHLDGQSALAYTRMREDDPRGDMGRNDRQRQVLLAAMRKAISPSMLPKLDDVFAKLQSNVKTNVTFVEMLKMKEQYGPALENVESAEINGEGTLMNDVYYYIVDQTERNRITAKMKSQLEIQ